MLLQDFFIQIGVKFLNQIRSDKKNTDHKHVLVRRGSWSGDSGKEFPDRLASLVNLETRWLEILRVKMKLNGWIDGALRIPVSIIIKPVIHA